MTDTPGTQLQVWRTRNRVKQGALARQLGISVSHLSTIENGHQMPGGSLGILIETLTGVRFAATEASEAETVEQEARS